jgi:hypothetical protein
MRKLFFSVLLTSAFGAHAGEWLTDSTTQCKIWSPDETPYLQIRWMGDCKNGKANGVGVLEWLKDGELQSVAQRTYVDGWLQIRSRGSFTWPNGSQYEGDFLDGKHTGKGVFTLPNGDRYEGDFVDGKRTGKGVFTWSSKESYEGEFLNDKFHGKGVLIAIDGERYESEFSKGMPTEKIMTAVLEKGLFKGAYSEGGLVRSNLITLSSGEKIEIRFVLKDGQVKIYPPLPISNKP